MVLEAITHEGEAGSYRFEIIVYILLAESYILEMGKTSARSSK